MYRFISVNNVNSFDSSQYFANEKYFKINLYESLYPNIEIIIFRVTWPKNISKIIAYDEPHYVMVCVLALSAVDRLLERRSDQTKGYKIGICCFSTKHKVLRRRC